MTELTVSGYQKIKKTFLTQEYIIYHIYIWVSGFVRNASGTGHQDHINCVHHIPLYTRSDWQIRHTVNNSYRRHVGRCCSV